MCSTCAAEAQALDAPDDRVVARAAAQRAQRRIHRDEDGAADVRLDHGLERVDRRIDLAEVRVGDGEAEVHAGAVTPVRASRISVRRAQ